MRGTERPRSYSSHRAASRRPALLKSLWKSRNVAGAGFDKLLDYPRNRYNKERAGAQEITLLEFELSPEELVSLVAAVPGISAPPNQISLKTWYEAAKVKNSISFEPPLELPMGHEAVTVLQALAAAIEPNEEDEATNAFHKSLAKSLDQAKAEEWLWSQANTSALERAASAAQTWAQSDASRESLAIAEKSALGSVLAESKKGDCLALADEWVEKNLPTFIYFDEYGQLDTQIHLPTYLRLKDDPSDAKARTQSALFEWSGLDPKEILELGKQRRENETEEQVHRRLEERRALLDSASFSLSGDWTSWWTGEGHRLVFDADGEYLVLRVSDSNNPFPIPFGERSRGFQWFFSFYLVFLVESKRAHKDAILLLDEPGLHLHPTLQEKLIDLFDRVSERNQLLYSTHLPFLIDGSHLERVRTVYLSGASPPKTVVSNELRPTGDRDTLFPLQAALGYSIAQTLFIGKWTTIVEGITDFWILKALNACLASLGNNDTLHDDIVLIPAGGTSKLMPLASIMLASMSHAQGRLIVLLDSDTAGKQAAERLEKTFDKEAPVIMLGTPLGRSDATIEDLIPRARYAAAVKKAEGRPFNLDAKENAASTNVKCMELLFARKGWGDFGPDQKAAAALVLIAEWGEDCGKVPMETLDFARQLFREINQRFVPT